MFIKPHSSTPTCFTVLASVEICQNISQAKIKKLLVSTSISIGLELPYLYYCANNHNKKNIYRRTLFITAGCLINSIQTPVLTKRPLKSVSCMFVFCLNALNQRIIIIITSSSSSLEMKGSI